MSLQLNLQIPQLQQLIQFLCKVELFAKVASVGPLDWNHLVLISWFLIDAHSPLPIHLAPVVMAASSSKIIQSESFVAGRPTMHT